MSESVRELDWLIGFVWFLGTADVEGIEPAGEWEVVVLRRRLNDLVARSAF